jgi:hypothetical protein
VEIVVDPEIQAQFDANLAEYQARSGRVEATLTAEQQQIAEQSRQAEERSAAERTELLDKLKQDFKEPTGNEPPRRPVGWNPVDGDGSRDKPAPAFNTDEEEAAPRPAPRRPAPRHRAASDEDDYSEQTWMRD